MYTFINSEHARKELLRELPPFVLSITLAELCYKFHSFTRECTAFLATWYAASYILSALLPVSGGETSESEIAERRGYGPTNKEGRSYE